MQRRQHALRRIALRLERAVGEEAGAVQRDRLRQSGRRVVLDELDRAAAGEERVHGVGLGRRDFGQQRLELDVRERQRQLLDHLSARGGDASLKPCTDSSPAAYFHVIVTTFFAPLSPATLPIA